MTSKQGLKIAGLVATVVGSVISIAAAIISDKRQELEIQEAVDKALADKSQEEES